MKFKSLGLLALLTAVGGVCAAAPALFLKAYERTPDDLADHPLGYLWVHKPLLVQVEANALWYVRVVGALPVFTTARLAKVAQARRLPGLDFSQQPQLSDADLRPLRGLRDLRFLSLVGTGVTDAGLATVARWPTLESLTLSPGITNAGLKSLRGLANLRELSLAHTDVTDAGLPVLAKFRRLETLDLSAKHIGDAQLAVLTALPLKRLTLGPKATDAGMDAVKTLSRLEQLDLSATRVTDGGIERLAGLTALRTFFGSRFLTGKSLVLLSRLPELRRLDLSGAKLENGSIAILAQFPHLEELALSGTPIGDEGLDQLKTLSKLHTLEISDTPITPLGLLALAGLPHLEVISLSWKGYPRLSDLKPLGSLPALRLVLVNGVPLSREGMRMLKASVAAPESPLTPSAEPSLSQAKGVTPIAPGKALAVDQPQTAANHQAPMYEADWPSPALAPPLRSREGSEVVLSGMRNIHLSEAELEEAHSEPPQSADIGFNP